MGLIDVWREHEQQRPHPQRRTHYTTVRTKRTLYFVVFVLVPVYPTTFVFCIFFVWEKSGESFLKFTFFSFRLWWKESTFDYSQFWWEEEILTLVADQGLNFFPFLFDCLYFNGNVGAGSDFLSSFEIFWKNGWFQTNWTLCAVLRWEGVVLPGLRTKGYPLGTIHGYSGGTPIHPIDITHGPHRASSLYV